MLFTALSVKQKAAVLSEDETRNKLKRTLDSDNGGVPKHLGQIADSMSEWEGRIADELGLTKADVNHIKSKHAQDLKLQS